MFEMRVTYSQLAKSQKFLYFIQMMLLVCALPFIGYIVYDVTRFVLLYKSIDVLAIGLYLMGGSVYVATIWLYRELYYLPLKIRKSEGEYLRNMFLRDMEEINTRLWKILYVTWTGFERDIKYEFTLCLTHRIMRQYCSGFADLVVSIPAGAWDKVYEDILPKVKNKEFKVEDLYDVKYVYVDGEKILLKDTEYWTLMFMLSFEEQLKQNEDFIRVRQIIRSPNRYYRKGEGY